MTAESEPLESYYASDTLNGLMRSGLTLLKSRRVKHRDEEEEFHLGEFLNQVLFVMLIGGAALALEIYHRIRRAVTGISRGHKQGEWQFYLQTGLREDLAHFTNETTGYHESRPEDATGVDDLTAWVMAVIQFLWNYEDLMAAVWDEWTLLRLVKQAAEDAEMSSHELFNRLQRQWEVVRPYSAPLNGTYADIRRAHFEAFIQPRLDILPDNYREKVIEAHSFLAKEERKKYQQQMSLLASLEPTKFKDIKRPIPLWDARIGLIVCGQYYLLHVADHAEAAKPVVYGQSGRQWWLQLDDNGTPVTPIGDKLVLQKGQFYREEDGQPVGFLDMAPATRIKWQIRDILERCHQMAVDPDTAVDVLLTETPRKSQEQLRGLLPAVTRVSLEELAKAPIIINWDAGPRDSSLAELRRAQRGIGDHALTIIHTDSSFIFDQSHIFFDGTWSLAMAEVLTNAAIEWCRRVTTIAPSETASIQPLSLRTTKKFVKEAQEQRQVPEVSAETTIWDISNIFTLRKRLRETGTFLTVNDLLVTTRIFHAAHYNPSPSVQSQIDEFKATATTHTEKRAVDAIARSLQRGRVINPALLIPVDASPTDPTERLYPITFRNLADNLVWIWDDTWEAYQEYRKHDPANTPEGIAAFQQFALKRTLLIGNLRAFSYILDANKSVALRGDSIEIAILRLISRLPLWLQVLLKQIPEEIPPLNEVIRGDEVYSNVGRVVKGSSLKRFMTAKDDGNTKALAWGIMTDDEGRMIVTMRDFRPHVKPLLRAGRMDLANAMAQNYVVTYTADLIGLVARLSAMLQAESPTKQASKHQLARTEETAA